MSELKKQPVVMLSTDETMRDPASDTALRMKEYTKLYESVHVVVCAKNISGPTREVLPGVFMYPVPYRLKPVGFLKTVVKTWGVVHRVRPESIVAQDPFLFGFIGLLVGRPHNIPVVVGLYGTDIRNVFIRKESLKHRFYVAIAGHMLGSASAIQTDGPETVEWLRKKYGKKVFFKLVIPANLDTLRAVSRRTSENPFRVLFVGRFVKQKNIPLLISVIEETFKQGGNSVRFSIAGDGPEKKMFVDEVTKRGIEGIVEDKGVLSRSGIAEAYATHHALLLVSHYEGFPKVFMEAAVTGLPIVTTDVSGVKGLVIDGESGYVLPQGSEPSTYAEKILFLRDNRDVLEKFSHNITSTFEKEYGGKTIADFQRPLAEFVQSLHL